MIKACHPCRPGPAAEYQDKKYGRGLRVHTPFVKGNGGARCTVCAAEKK